MCVADPSAYRACDAFARDRTGKTGRLEVVTVAVTEGGVSVDAFESGGAAGVPREPAAAGASGSSAQQRSESGERKSGARGETPLDTRRLGEDLGANLRLEDTTRVTSASDGDDAARAVHGPASRVSRVLRDARGPRSERGVTHEAGPGVEVLFARGKIADLPDAFASRRERFAPLDDAQAGWTVELRRRDGSSAVDAVFFDPDGVGYKAFADARREALRAKKRAGEA